MKCPACNGATLNWIEMCCNDPDNGSPLGKSETVQFSNGNGKSGTLELTLEGPAIVTRQAQGYLQFGRYRVKFLSYKTWFGNWCWDAALVKRKDARRAINILLERGWEITEGPEELFDLTKGNSRIPSKYDRKRITSEQWDAAQCAECHGTGVEKRAEMSNA